MSKTVSDGQRRSFVVLVALAALGQLTLLVYEIALTSRFGTTHDADALALAFMVAYALGNEVHGWVAVVFIPRYLGSETEGGPELARGFLSAALVATGVTASVLALVTFAVAPVLLKLLATGPAAEDSLLRLFSPLIVLLPLTAVLANALQARERFALAALRPVWWYGSAFLAVIVAADTIGPAIVPIGMVAGLLAYGISLGFAAAPLGCAARRAGWMQVRSVAPLMGPLLAMSAANYGQILVERAVAGHLPGGSLAAVTYAFRLLNAPITLVALSAATVLFPILSARTVGGSRVEAGRLLMQALRVAVVLTVPAVALMMTCANPLVRVLFERGAFTRESSLITALALFYYAPALVGLAALQLLIRGYWALRLVKRLAWIQVSMAVFGAVAMVALTRMIGFRGLPVAVSLTSVLQSVTLLVGLTDCVAGLAFRPIVRLVARVGTAGLLGGLAAAAAGTLGNGAFSELTLGLVAGGLTYVTVVRRLALTEWAEAIRVVTGKRAETWG